MLVLHHAGGGALAVSGSGDGGGVENGELTLRLVSSKPQLTVAEEKKRWRGVKVQCMVINEVIRP